MPAHACTPAPVRQHRMPERDQQTILHTPRQAGNKKAFHSCQIGARLLLGCAPASSAKF